MKYLLIILFVAFSFVPSLLARAKRRVAEAATVDDEPSYDGQDDNFFDFEEPEAEPAKQSSYFTYETPEAEPKAAEVPVQAAALVEEPVRPSFDVRQAVIYQTILTNNYINSGN
jgi:hypothetical protein